MEFSPGVRAVDNASFDLQAGRFLTVLGPSGSGKTTLLHMIAGFLKPSGGEIAINGRPVDAVAPHRRSVGMVFQKLALFPHMTAAENVAFPLKMRRWDPRGIPARVAEFLDLVRLGGYRDRRIHELSGGQQQRVAIARALVFEPELLLLDEPLAALDRKLREEMQLEFRRIQKELHVTTINVTHDQREALVVSDEIIVMEGGVIQQYAPPLAIYRQPANAFVAGFVGVSTFLDGVASPAGMRVGGTDCAGRQALPLAEGTPVRGALRAEQISLGPAGDMLAGCDTVLPGRIADMIFEGERLLYIIDSDALPGAEIRIYHHDPTGFDLFEAGAAIRFGWQAQDLKIFKTGRKEPTGGVLQ
ncbi:ABC transporter ATP-binding protein [Paracoccus lutimaris]|uniref:Putative spermidine/putrescine transport system ATP-binding protein n=1 Tax=Paracoccus lutimaris TaxID=1490030 RepID=A0A368Z3T4_9RHOB|nr:ABC transporter ATP-binding protein [Paracoccus lutimaris]RCW87122.1 putative spermidine/putrescine transport system ATP-binding protein [Paracoccus lutimaris]